MSLAPISNLEVTVLCPGVLYGCGEEVRMDKSRLEGGLKAPETIS